MLKANHFVIEELVPRETFEVRGEKSWELIDSRLITALDDLRLAFGPIYINTWHSEKLQAAVGYREWSGLRPPSCEIGATLSQHRFGRAADCLFKNLSAEEVRRIVLEHPHKFPLITALELDVSWFHFDVRNTTRIKTF